MINKKGESALGPILRWGIVAFIVIVIFFGGLKTIIGAFSFINKVPAWAWVVFGIIILLMIVGKKKR